MCMKMKKLMMLLFIGVLLYALPMPTMAASAKTLAPNKWMSTWKSDGSYNTAKITLPCDGTLTLTMKYGSLSSYPDAARLYISTTLGGSDDEIYTKELNGKSSLTQNI